MSKKRRPYQRRSGPLTADRRRKEWVELEDGDICCWSLSAGEMLQMRDHAERPAIDPRGGISSSVASVWLVALSAHDGEEESARRIWDDMSLSEIYQLSNEDYLKLIRAAGKVNGISVEEVRALQDFTPATGAPNSSGSSSSASKNSDASPARSTSLITS